MLKFWIALRRIAYTPRAEIVACSVVAAAAVLGLVQAHAAAADVERHHVMSALAAPEQPDNLARTAIAISGSRGRTVVSTFSITGVGSNGPQGSIQPGVGIWDEPTDTVVADKQINVPPYGNYTTALANANHDAPSVIRAANGAILVAYGAASTYRAYSPPAAWSCYSNVFCQPFKFAPSDAVGPRLPDVLSRSPEYLLPSAGISEISSATIGRTTIIAGQQQTTSPFGQPGAQGYVVFRSAGDGGTFDTAAGAWDFRSSHAAPADGMQTVSLVPNDDAFVDFAVRRTSGGTGSISLNIDGAACAVSGLSGDTTAVVDAFVRGANASCPAFAGRYRAMRVRYDPLLRVGGSPAAPDAVGLVASRGDATQFPGVRSISLSCAGGITCASSSGENRVNDVRGSGLHRHFLWGGMVHIGSYVYDLIDVQQVTGSWYGAGHNSLALALACFRAREPASVVWTWTNCAGASPFQVGPGMKPAFRLGAGSPYLVRAPDHGYAPGMLPYITDWRMSAQPPESGNVYPVISAESIVQLPGGNLLIAHACQPQGGGYAICFLRYDTSSGATVDAGFVDRPGGGGSQPSIALGNAGTTISLAALVGMGQRWGCGASGGCAITYAYDAASNAWRRTGAHVLGGRNNIGFPGIVTAETDGYLFQRRDLIGAASSRVETFEIRPPR